jgi:uncharacterized protein YicC (UPF0701 family)
MPKRTTSPGFRYYKQSLERLLSTVQVIRQRVETTSQPERLATMPKDLPPKLNELSVQMKVILQEVQRCRAESLQRHNEHVQEQRKQRAGHDAWIITMILAFIAGAGVIQVIHLLT